MSRFWSEVTKNIKPYVPGEQPRDKKYIKLNTNESPYPPSPRVIEAINTMNLDELRLYPDPECTDLMNEIIRFYDVNKKQVFVGNGSDEVLAFSFKAFFNAGDTIIYPDITYSFYPVYTKLFSLSPEVVKLEDDFTVNVNAFCSRDNGIIISNPNAPTGIALSLESIEKIVKTNSNKIVIIDEAYIDFGAETAVKLVDLYDNLLVIQTLSKSRSLAGMRVGFAIGHEDLIEGLNRVKNSINSYTLDRMAIVAGAEAFKDKDYFETTVSKTISTRAYTTVELRSLGFEVLESSANFVFATHPKFNAEDIYKSLREAGILVRYFKLDRIDNFLRISIGTDEEMKQLIIELNRILPKID